MPTLTDVVLNKLRTRGVAGVRCDCPDLAPDRTVTLINGLEDIVRVARSNGGIVYLTEVTFGDDAFRFEFDNPHTGSREVVDLLQFPEFRRFEYCRGNVAFHILYVPSHGCLIRAFGNAADWYCEFTSLREALLGRLLSQAV